MLETTEDSHFFPDYSSSQHFEERREYASRRNFFRNGVEGRTLPHVINEHRGYDHELRETYGARRAYFAANALATPAEAHRYDEANPKSLRMLATVCAVVVLSLSTWFSSSAILPQLLELWEVDDPALGSLLTLLVNFGFIFGATASTLVGAADRYPASFLMSGGALGSAVFNFALLGCQSFEAALVLRFLCGVCFALIYPVACKVVTTWFVTRRGLAMGIVTGSVVLGSAAPHFVLFISPASQWQVLTAVCASASLLGAALSKLAVRDGPFGAPRREFCVGEIWKLGQSGPLLCSFVGYFGHNWELYGLWSGFKSYLLAVQARGGDVDERAAALAMFFVISIGVVGCVLGGELADRFGRVPVVVWCLAVSSASSLVVGHLEADGTAVLVVGLVWGLAAVTDSPQYSALVSETCPPELLGTAIMVQMALGYIFTLPCMFAVPWLEENLGWVAAWSFLAPGPLCAVAAMLRLRRLRRLQLAAAPDRRTAVVAAV